MLGPGGNEEDHGSRETNNPYKSLQDLVCMNHLSAQKWQPI